MGRALKYNQIAAFWDKVMPEPNTGCWIWIGALNKGGYGSFTVDSKPWKAHRYSYYLDSGEIDPDLDVLHKCDNTWCVNPAHLFQGTALDNITDMMSKNRGNKAKGERNCKAKLREGDVSAIRSFKDVSSSELSAIYGVSPSTIRRIIRGETWSHV